MHKTIIIAEAGVNNNGDLGLAKQLIDAAAEASADYIKFQIFKADKLVSKTAKQAEYQVRNQGGQNENTQYSMLKKLELSEQDHHILQSHALEKGIKFLTTGFDEESMDFLDSLGIDLFKIPSGEITNSPYLGHLARKRKPLVLSTGMATLGEIEAALDVLISGGALLENITVLTDYPTRYQDVNLGAMQTLQQAFKVAIGYSDHTLGIEVPIAAVALGARIIEKQVTLDRSLPGPDHKTSLEPGELKQTVSAIRNIEQALSGTGRKQPTASELKNKSIHLKVSVISDDTIDHSKLEMKRPDNGISPMDLIKVTRRKVNADLEAGTHFTWTNLQ